MIFNLDISSHVSPREVNIITSKMDLEHVLSRLIFLIVLNKLILSQAFKLQWKSLQFFSSISLEHKNIMFETPVKQVKRTSRHFTFILKRRGVTKACSAFPKYLMANPFFNPPSLYIDDPNKCIHYHVIADFESKKILVFV